MVEFSLPRAQSKLTSESRVFDSGQAWAITRHSYFYKRTRRCQYFYRCPHCRVSRHVLKSPRCWRGSV
ncbi:hypothetical protein HOLleu_37869 [Holothuria leucospilota]|uniref:Uncharacterized protein n=1 Tax=Holothuria leucospilota TaxID=206669 RepID=A0A9Q0YLJ3_HOLLE|nr:hypothetical protein HOLleu_37869 [Holothuria leucospilota]